MTGERLAGRCARALRSILVVFTTLTVAGGIAHAEPVTPWGVAQTILPDTSGAPDPVGPPVMPAIPGGLGAVMGPGSAPRQGGFLQPSAQTPALPRPRLSEHPDEQVPSELNRLADVLPALRAARERPLFSASRRPQKLAPAAVAQVVAPVAVPPPTAPALRLIGIVQDPESAAGLVRRGSGPPTLVLRTGDMIDGWSVSEIGPAHLTIRLGDQVQTHRLFAATTPPRMRPRPMPRQDER